MKLIEKPFFIPLVIFLLNIAFKSINLDTYPVWYDEVWGIYFFQGSFEEAISISKWDVNPPFFSVLLCAWMKVFGISEIAVRSFSVFFSSATAVLLFLFIKKFFDQKTALIASMLFLASNASYFFAHEARGYALIQFMSIASTWLIFEMIRQPKWWQALLIGALYYSLFMTHFLTGFLFAVQALIICSTFKRKTILYYIASCSIFLVLFSHFIPRFSEIFFTGERTTWLWHPSYEELWKMFYYFHNGDFAFFSFYTIVIVSLLLMLYKKESITKEQLRILVFAFLISFGIILTNFYVSTVLPMFLERYLLYTLTGFIILISFFVAKLPLHNIIAYSIVGMACIYLMWNIDTTTPKNMNYRKVVSYVRENRDDETDVVLQANKILFAYYFDREAFKDYNHMEERLNKQYVSVGMDSGSYKKLILSPHHKRLILVQTYQEAMDPDSTLVKRILQDYHLTQKPGPFEGAQVWVFEK